MQFKRAAAEVAGYTEPVIPEILSEYFDDTAQEAHERMQRMDVGDIPCPQPRLDGSGQLYYELLPKDPDTGRVLEHDPTRAIVDFFPFANGLSPHMILRCVLLQRSLGEPVKLIAFPNNTLRTQHYGFTRPQFSDLRSGSFDPTTEGPARVFDTQGIERVDAYGYSQGGSVTANLLKRAKQSGTFMVQSVVIFDPPNIVQRTGKELFDDFSAPGMKPFRQAARDAAIPVLQEVYGTEDNALKQLASMVVFGLGAILSKENRALARAMTGGVRHNVFMDDAIRQGQEVDKDHSVFAYGKTGRIVTARALELLEAELAERFNVFALPGGHELADNIVVDALLAKAAIEGVHKADQAGAVAISP